MIRLGLSNLAFKDESLASALEPCAAFGFSAFEIAPALIWPDPAASRPRQRAEVRRMVEDAGLEIAALQSVLFAQPQLQLFESDQTRRRMADYLKAVIDLCRDLGAGILSFGAWRNRLRGGREMDEAMDIAATFFSGVARSACQAGVVICFEPLSADYGCDFVRNGAEGLALVERVNQDSFKLLLDTGNALLNGIDPKEEIRRAGSRIGHIHLNAPRLEPPALSGQAGIRETLEEIGYRGYATFEFLAPRLDLSDCLAAVRDCYLETGRDR